jgi:hypothetical protein
MAGFRRTNIHGHTVVADPELVRQVRRLASAQLSRLFREAQEHGQSRVELAGKMYTILRHPDHTFTIGDDRSMSIFA